MVMKIKSSVMLRRVDCLTLNGSTMISETSETIYQSTNRNIVEDQRLQVLKLHLSLYSAIPAHSCVRYSINQHSPRHCRLWNARQSSILMLHILYLNGLLFWTTGTDIVIETKCGRVEEGQLLLGTRDKVAVERKTL